ncbi:MAG: hypothetical protein P8J86_05205 [Phycisphaerales bacterium]|nr:hypothetical protein [Phycisphaerales bacterium]
MNHVLRFRHVLATVIGLTIGLTSAGCQSNNSLGIDENHSLVVMSVSMENLIVPEQHPIPQTILISDGTDRCASIVLNPDWPVTEGTENLMGMVFGPVIDLMIGDQGSPRNLVGVRLSPGNYELVALRGSSENYLLADGLFQMPIGSTFTIKEGNRAYYLGHLDARLHLRESEEQSPAAIGFPRVPDLAGFNEGSFDIDVKDLYSEDFNKLAVSYPAISQVPHEQMLLKLPAVSPQPNYELRPFPIDGYIGSLPDDDGSENNQ